MAKAAETPTVVGRPLTNVALQGNIAEGAIYSKEGESGVLYYRGFDQKEYRVTFDPKTYKYTYKPDTALAIGDWADESSQTVTIGTDLDYVVGDRIEISFDHDNYWIAEVTAYDSDTGSITFTVTEGVSDGTDTYSIFTFDIYNPVVRNENVLAVKFIGTNYSAIVAQTRFTPAEGDFAIARQSQGTAYLPGAFGGTFYPAGLYQYDSASEDWEYLDETLAEGIYEAVQNQPPAQIATSTNKEVAPGGLIFYNNNLYTNVSGSTIENVTSSTDFTTSSWQQVANIASGGGGGGDADIVVTSTSVSDGTNTFNKFTAADVDTALGITNSGSANKYLDELGAFTQLSFSSLSGSLSIESISTSDAVTGSIIRFDGTNWNLSTVNSDLGISDSGSATKYLNEQGDFVTVSGGGGGTGTVTDVGYIGGSAIEDVVKIDFDEGAFNLSESGSNANVTLRDGGVDAVKINRGDAFTWTGVHTFQNDVTIGNSTIVNVPGAASADKLNLAGSVIEGDSETMNLYDDRYTTVRHYIDRPGSGGGSISDGARLHETEVFSTYNAGDDGFQNSGFGAYIHEVRYGEEGSQGRGISEWSVQDTESNLYTSILLDHNYLGLESVTSGNVYTNIFKVTPDAVTHTTNDGSGGFVIQRSGTEADDQLQGSIKFGQSSTHPYGEISSKILDASENDGQMTLSVRQGSTDVSAYLTLDGATEKVTTETTLDIQGGVQIEGISMTSTAAELNVLDASGYVSGDDGKAITYNHADGAFELTTISSGESGVSSLGSNIDNLLSISGSILSAVDPDINNNEVRFVTWQEGDGTDPGLFYASPTGGHGINIFATEWSVDLKTNSGLAADSDGLEIDLRSSFPGLEIDSNGLGILLDENGGIDIDSNGLTLELNGSTLTKGSSGVRVNYNHDFEGSTAWSKMHLKSGVDTTEQQSLVTRHDLDHHTNPTNVIHSGEPNTLANLETDTSSTITWRSSGTNGQSYSGNGVQTWYFSPLNGANSDSVFFSDSDDFSVYTNTNSSLQNTTHSSVIRVDAESVSLNSTADFAWNCFWDAPSLHDMTAVMEIRRRPASKVNWGNGTSVNASPTVGTVIFRSDTITRSAANNADQHANFTLSLVEGQEAKFEKDDMILVTVTMKSENSGNTLSSDAFFYFGDDIDGNDHDVVWTTTTEHYSDSLELVGESDDDYNVGDLVLRITGDSNSPYKLFDATTGMIPSDVLPTDDNGPWSLIDVEGTDDGVEFNVDGQPFLVTHNTSSSISSDDTIGHWHQRFQNDADETVNGVGIRGEVKDTTNGSEDASLYIQAVVDGATETELASFHKASSRIASALVVYNGQEFTSNANDNPLAAQTIAFEVRGTTTDGGGATDLFRVNSSNSSTDAHVDLDVPISIQRYSDPNDINGAGTGWMVMNSTTRKLQMYDGAWKDIVPSKLWEGLNYENFDTDGEAYTIDKTPDSIGAGSFGVTSDGNLLVRLPSDAIDGGGFISRYLAAEWDALVDEQDVIRVRKDDDSVIGYYTGNFTAQIDNVWFEVADVVHIFGDDPLFDDNATGDYYFELPSGAVLRFDTGRDGLVPGPTDADVTNNRVLRADGTWVAQSGGGGGGSLSFVNGSNTYASVTSVTKGDNITFTPNSDATDVTIAAEQFNPKFLSFEAYDNVNGSADPWEYAKYNFNAFRAMDSPAAYDHDYYEHNNTFYYQTDMSSVGGYSEGGLASIVRTAGYINNAQPGFVVKVFRYNSDGDVEREDLMYIDTGGEIVAATDFRDIFDTSRSDFTVGTWTSGDDDDRTPTAETDSNFGKLTIGDWRGFDLSHDTNLTARYLGSKHYLYNDDGDLRGIEYTSRNDARV